MATAWSVATPERVVSEAPVRTTPAGGRALSADGELLAGSTAILGLSLAVVLGLRASRRSVQIGDGAVTADGQAPDRRADAARMTRNW